MAPGTQTILTHEEERVLLHIARDAMKDCVTHGTLRAMDQYPLTPTLREPHGVFVTLRCANHLRGRAGGVHNQAPLAQALQQFTVMATLHDDEYRPVAPNETDDIDVEIAVVCSGEPLDTVEDAKAIDAEHDGLAVCRPDGSVRAAVLPRESRRRHWTAAQCLTNTRRRAHTDSGRVIKFGVQEFGEPHHSDYPD